VIGLSTWDGAGHERFAATLAAFAHERAILTVIGYSQVNATS
jgi:hypothetical protein